MDSTGGGIVLFLLLIVYLLPGVVAWMRGHRNQNAIFVLNLLLGWTVLGWIVALVWAMMADRDAPNPYRQNPNQ